MTENINNKQPATLKDFLTFPCAFEFKIVGTNCEDYFKEMQLIMANHLNIAPEKIANDWHIRYSKTQKYATINYMIMATGEEMIYSLQKEIQQSPYVITCL
jgi:putative lipoic acid-binding regulatory protein